MGSRWSGDEAVAETVRLESNPVDEDTEVRGRGCQGWSLISPRLWLAYRTGTIVTPGEERRPGAGGAVRSLWDMMHSKFLGVDVR